jgi:hypothetical protein
MQARIPQEEYCPVSDQVLGQLYRVSPHGLDELVASVPAKTRAALALYCYGRAHLRSIGLAIATRCDEFELQNLGGHAGVVLFTKARDATEHLPLSHYQARRNVSLSAGILKHVVQADEDDF